MQNYNQNQNNHCGQGGSPWQNNNNDFNNQKKLEEDRKKQQYKFFAEQAVDRIVREYKNAQQNNLQNWQIDASDKADVVRYSKRYWDNHFVALSLITIVLTYILSFYTQYAVGGILIIFILREILSQKVFMRYLLNDHDLSEKEIINIKDKIFFKQLRTKTTFILTVILTVISYFSHSISTNLFIEIKTEVLQKLLSKFYTFHLENELFAYINVISIFILLSLKIYEKWSK